MTKYVVETLQTVIQSLQIINTFFTNLGFGNSVIVYSTHVL